MLVAHGEFIQPVGHTWVVYIHIKKCNQLQYEWNIQQHILWTQKYVDIANTYMDDDIFSSYLICVDDLNKRNTRIWTKMPLT